LVATETKQKVTSTTSAYNTGESLPPSGSSAPQTPATNVDPQKSAPGQPQKSSGAKTTSVETKTPKASLPSQSAPNVSALRCSKLSLKELKTPLCKMFKSTKTILKVNTVNGSIFWEKYANLILLDEFRFESFQLRHFHTRFSQQLTINC